MSKLLGLRVLVNERLTAAVEEVFALFERTIEEYEEKLLCSEKEKQKLVLLLPRARAVVHSPPQSPPGPGPNQQITGFKEEPEEQVEQKRQQPRSFPNVCAVHLKREDSSLFQTQSSNFSSDFLPDTERTHNEDGREGTFNWSAPQMKTNTDEEDQCNQVWVRDRSTANASQLPEYKSVPEMSVNYGDMAGTDEEAEKKKPRCPYCQKTFRCHQSLKTHIRVHTGERPHACPFCEKAFNVKGNLKKHIRTHTNEKPYSCPFCEKSFARKDGLDLHRKIHTGEKPYSCSVCKKDFIQSSNLRKHMKTHTKGNLN